MAIYISVQGGLGKNCSLTGLTKELKEKYGEVNVLSPYFDIFEACPYVDNAYKPTEYRDFIFDAKMDDATLVIDHMYDTQKFIYKKQSYEDAWREMLGLDPVKAENPGSSMKVELDPLSAYPGLTQLRDQILQAIKFKKFVIMQFTGGQSPLVQVPNGDWSKVPYDYDNEPLKRHYPKDKAQMFVDLFAKAHPDVGIVLYQLPNEPKPDNPNVITAVVPYMVYNLLAREKKCAGIVTIDSSLQHITAGLTKTVVIWGHSLPDSFGYSYNKNIIQDCRRDEICYFTPLGPSGAKVKYIEPEDLLASVEEYLNV